VCDVCVVCVWYVCMWCVMGLCVCVVCVCGVCCKTCKWTIAKQHKTCYEGKTKGVVRNVKRNDLEESMPRKAP